MQVKQVAILTLLTKVRIYCINEAWSNFTILFYFILYIVPVIYIDYVK